MRKWLAMLLAVGLVVAACGGGGDATAVPTAGPTATSAPAPTAVPTAVPTLTPLPKRTGSTGTLNIARSRIGSGGYLTWFGSVGKNYLPFFDRLFNLNTDGVTVVPGLVERFEIPADGKAITFFLRQGVPWHGDWGEFTAEDVKWSIDKSLAPESKSSGGLLKPVMDRIEVISPSVLTIFITAPYGGDLPSLHKRTTVVSKRYVETVGEDEANRKGIFTGPYKIVQDKDGEIIKLEVVENHWRLTPEFQFIVIREVPEEATRVALLKRGDTDIIETTHTIAQALGDEGFKTVRFSSTNNMAFPLYGQWLPPNENFAPFENKKVREALNLAINRQ